MLLSRSKDGHDWPVIILSIVERLTPMSRETASTFVLLRLMRFIMRSTKAAWSAALVRHGSGMSSLSSPEGHTWKQSRGLYGYRAGTSRN